MLPDDQILAWCNETELLGIAFSQGLGRLRSGIPREELIAIVAGEVQVRPEHLSETGTTRQVLQDFIFKNWEKLRSQLPGCTGKCVTFECTETKHASCFFFNKAQLQL